MFALMQQRVSQLLTRHNSTRGRERRGLPEAPTRRKPRQPAAK